MPRKIFVLYIPILLGLAAVTLIFGWVGAEPKVAVDLRLPGADETPEDAGFVEGPVKLEGTLVKSSGVPSEFPGSWPWFRGVDFNAAVELESLTPARSWAEGGPKQLWAVEVGDGYAGAAVHDGRVYIVDYDRETLSDTIRCLSLDDGAEIWRYSYPVKITYNHGMSRTVPAVTDDYVVALGPMCHLTCLDAKTGEFKWMYNLPMEFGTEVPLWYAGQCPFIEDGKAIIAPGGDCLMMAVDCETGEVVWKTENPNDWQMTHSSITPMEFAGKKMYVYSASGGIVGVSAEDGKILWQTDEWKMRTNVPSPVVVGDGKLFLTAGYGKGSMMLKLTETDGTISAEPVFELKPKVFGSEQHTPVFYEGYIYGMRPDWQMACLDLEGNTVWESGSANKFQKLGPYMIINGVLYVMDGTGTLTMIEASPAGYRELDSAKVLDGIESWGPMAVVGNRLIVRDLKEMRCIEIGD